MQLIASPRTMFITSALSLWVLASAVQAEEKFSFDKTPGKLPKDVIPRHYSIELRPDIESGATTGSETIQIEVLRPVTRIVFNALDMSITRAEIPGAQGQLVIPEFNNEQQTVTLKLAQPLPAGNHELRLDFKGKISEKPEGLYFDRFQTSSGEKRMLATQMEATDARRMFPCWDEPVFRATFQLTVTVPESHIAISNMPADSEEKTSDGFKKVRFQRTPSMATYLMVLISGDLEELSDEVEGVKLRIFTTAGKREQARYAMEATKKLIPYYHRYFGVKYALPKLDQIAVQSFAYGAMENWGGIVYREDILLLDPTTSTPATKENIFGVIAHEIAHQWFGNLVTMAWWDNLWLNEGFASWMGTKATDHFNPDWQIWLRANGSKDHAMQLDARRVTHKIQQPIENESQASDAFDEITYQKGQAFLRMLESYLGEPTFQRGIQQYISQHRYSNTTTADLWEALEDVSKKPVKALAAAWTEQPGFPFVRAAATCASGTWKLELQQQRFTLNFPDAPQLRWKIPVSVSKGDRVDTFETVLLADSAQTFSLKDCPELWKANAAGVGYYRAQYDAQTFERLRGKIERFGVADQLNLLSDTWAFVQANLASASDYLGLVEALKRTPSLALWEQILTALDFIERLQEGRPGAKPFAEYATSILHPQFERLGWNPRTGEPHGDALLRAGLIEILGRLGDPQIIAEATRRFREFIERPDSLPAELKPAVMHVVGRYGDEATYRQLHELAKKAQGLEEKQLFYRALECAISPDLADRTLRLALTDELPPVYASRVIPSVAQSGRQAERAWNFAKEHMPQLIEKVPDSMRNRYVPSIFGGFSDAERADELEKYVRENLPADALKKAEEIADGIRFRYSFKQRQIEKIDEWVQERAKR